MICPVWHRVSLDNQFDLVREFVGKCQPSVKVGDKVNIETVVAHCEISAGQRLVKVAHVIGVSPKKVKKYLLRSVGDRIYQGEIIARKRGVLGVGKRELRSPADGVITDTDQNGDIIVKFLPTPFRLVAGANGVVNEIKEDYIRIRTFGTEIKGASGIGKAREGLIKIVAKPSEFIIPQKIDASCQGKIIVGGAHIDRASIEKALTVGVRGIVVGGIDYRDFVSLGIQSDVGVTIIITEGFGTVSMGKDIFEAFNKAGGRYAFFNGLEKSIFIPTEKEMAVTSKEIKREVWRQLRVGGLVRYFQPDSEELVGVVEALSPKEEALNSGLEAEIAQIKFLSGQKTGAPAANLEILS